MSTSTKPNFLIIVADDLGFSDTGPYGGEIATPTLDRLAKEGLVMTGFHTASACSPTRSMLLSGTDNHIAGLGQMAEYMGTDKTIFEGVPGYEGYLNFRVAVLSEILQDAGYLTIMSGKWHLGMTKELAPCSRGFTKNFTYLPGSGNHYAYEPQLDEKSPANAIKKTGKIFMENDEFIDRSDLERNGYYSSKWMSDKLVQFLDERTDEEKKQPFFSYLAFTAPHWPLQAPKEAIEKYKGVYDDGPEALRLRRLEALKKRGLVPQDVKAAPMSGRMHKEWHEFDAAEKSNSARRMETYAAMVDVMDQCIGQVVDKLEQTGELDNTFILFMSDNGAEGRLLEALPVMQDSPLVVIQKYYNNSTENIGNFDSFVWYGPRWASAATAPSRGMKAWTTEGGIRCPCIIRFPSLIEPAASVTHEFCSVMDILPTVLELADVPHPGTSFRGREVVLPRGSSWVPYLKSDDKAATMHPKGQDIMGWELFGRRAIRRGDWKAVYIPAPLGKDEWELFDLSNDLGETEDLAAHNPEILQDLLLEYKRYTEDTGIFEPEIPEDSAMRKFQRV